MGDEALLNARGASWVIPGATNVGIVASGDGAYAIDSGNDKEAGRKINKLLEGRNWKLLGIVNTHSNADHIGGNDYLQRMHGCPVFSSRAEKAFIESPEIEASFLWGGFPVRELRNKFFEAKPSNVTNVIDASTPLPNGMTAIPLPGHFFGMTGILTEDSVFYLGDCLFGKATLEKHRIPYVYDVREFRSSIRKVMETGAEVYVPSHGDIESDITATARANLDVVDRIQETILSILTERRTFDETLGLLCDAFGLALDAGRYALVGNTTRSFLSYLREEGLADFEFADNRMLWSVAR